MPERKRPSTRDRTSEEPHTHEEGSSKSVPLRPHHVFDPYIRGAITGVCFLDNPPVEKRGKLERPNDHKDDYKSYFTDTWGDSRSVREYVVAQRNEFLDRLRQLPDDTIIHLGLGKDALCDTCPIGKHCSATNMTHLGELLYTPLSEWKQLNMIYDLLVKHGFVEDVDFMFEYRTHSFEDYNGENLWTSHEPKSIKIMFRSMYVPIGVLRIALR
jgi:hypothetical protein